MPRKIEEPILVVEYEGRFAGWIGSPRGCRVYGDTEWIEHARLASGAKLNFSIHEGMVPLQADLNDGRNPAGAFAAFAWFARERIRVKQAPAGLMEELGLLMEPLELTVADEFENSVLSPEERDYLETHYLIETTNGEQWLPLNKPNGLWRDDLLKMLDGFADLKGDENKISAR